MPGSPPLDPPTVTALGIALATDLHHQHLASKPVLIGMDTRESGPVIAAQLASGLGKAGVEALFAGVITTPGVAYLTRTGDFSAGVMISASHNPFEDNGIKVFARTGYKLPDNEEHEIEEAISRILGAEPSTFLPAAPLVHTYNVTPYLDFLLSTIGVNLGGMKVVIDCGNGAAYALAPRLFEGRRRPGDRGLQHAGRTKHQSRLRRSSSR